jgi:hypothetical protein
VKGGENVKVDEMSVGSILKFTSLLPCFPKKENTLLSKLDFFLKNSFQWETPPHRRVKGGETVKVDEMSVGSILKLLCFQKRKRPCRLSLIYLKTVFSRKGIPIESQKAAKTIDPQA